jgi:hypothetical protein
MLHDLTLREVHLRPRFPVRSYGTDQLKHHAEVFTSRRPGDLLVAVADEDCSQRHMTVGRGRRRFLQSPADVSKSYRVLDAVHRERLPRASA